MPRRVEPDRINHFVKLRKLGFSMTRACQEAGVSRSWAYAFERDNPELGGGQQKINARRELKVPHPRSYEELSNDGKKAYDDFGFFREFFFARDTTPWQEEAAYRLEELLRSPRKEFVVLNCPPGVGKTTTFTHDIPAWLIARNRRIRCLLGHASRQTANKYTRRIKLSLERTDPYVDAERDVEAKGVMALEFGRFKPASQDLWRTEEFVVEQLGSRTVQEKEPTVMSAGMDTGYLGGRHDFNVWDDLVTASNQRTQAGREMQRVLFDDQAETRVEPGGLFLLMGQRIRADDLFRYALDKNLPVHELDMAKDRPGKKYWHIVYKAHYPELCEGEHGLDAKPWPDGCLLDPRRAPWLELAASMENDRAKFQTVYQQEDGDPERVLVKDVWLDGGTGDNGQVHVGCKDHDRDIAEWPRTLPPAAWTAVTVDPSAEQFWSIQWWGFEAESERRVLLDHVNERYQSPQFLERLRNGEYVGLMQEWVERAHDLSMPINFLIVEQNAAQRWMHQYEFFQSFMSKHRIAVLPHNTTSNKADPELGVWATLPTVYEHGLVRLPWKPGFGRRASEKLIREVTKWPEVRTEDCVMAQWFLEFNLEHLRFKANRAPTRSVPSWLKRTQRERTRVLTAY